MIVKSQNACVYCTFLTWKSWYWTVKLATQKAVPLQVLRDTLNCTLPIEIIYNGPREMDQWAVNKFQVPSLLMTCGHANAILKVHSLNHHH